jgi:hypothetical protein
MRKDNVLLRGSCLDLQATRLEDGLLKSTWTDLTLKATGVWFGFLILRICETSVVKGPRYLESKPWGDNMG